MWTNHIDNTHPNHRRNAPRRTRIDRNTHQQARQDGKQYGSASRTPPDCPQCARINAAIIYGPAMEV